LVYLGWSLYGAIVGTVLGSIVAYGISFFSLKKVLNSKAEHSDVGNIYAYTKPVFLFITGVIVFYGLDLFLAKIFFDPETSGSYAIASILAKIIFLATQPIGKVMFPLSVEEGNHKKKSSKLIITSLGLISLIILFALSIFYLFPDTLIMLFSGKSIPGLSKIILLLGIGASLLSITNFVLLYKLSIGKIGRPYFIFLFIIIEAILLSVFSQNILVFSVAYVLSSSLFLFGAIFFMGDN
jgi:O-antigen/teichoic acid export membrane protein